jgi:hypothetical protein
LLPVIPPSKATRHYQNKAVVTVGIRLMKTRERFMGIGQVVTMPIFFASSAIYPLTIIPVWLHTAARLNPLTHEVDALRALMLRRAALSASARISGFWQGCSHCLRLLRRVSTGQMAT